MAPVADGTVIDTDKDGDADLVADGAVEVGFDHYLWPGELRGVYEFDLGALHGQAAVSAARLMIPVNGHWGPTSVTPNPEVTLFTGPGDGVVGLSDFAGGPVSRRVNLFAYGSAAYIDVTTDVQGLTAAGADYLTVMIQPNPVGAGTPGTFGLASTIDAQYGFQEAQLSVVAGHLGSVDRPKGPYLVVENVRFTSTTFCSLVSADITNYGDAVQPQGWSITFDVPELGVSSTFSGEQALVPSQRMSFVHNPQITAPGDYRAVVSVGGATGRTRSGHAMFSVPCPAP
jgi:hypothetical protein